MSTRDETPGRTQNRSLTPEKLTFTYLSELLGRRVLDVTGETVGRLADLTAAPETVYPRVTGLLLQPSFRGKPVYVPWSSVRWPGPHGALTVNHPADSAGAPAGSDILLKKSFLDRQLISTSGYKVVRVNDLHLMAETSGPDVPRLWLVHIDIGVKGLLRRLGWGRAGNAVVRWLLDRDMKDVLVPWKFVQTATAANMFGSLQLSTHSSRLSEMHPADLADILEDLGADERNSMIEALDPVAAAATLSEMPLTLRVRIAESIDPAVLKTIVDQMQTDNVVDLLENLSPGERSALMAGFAPERVEEIRELSQLSPSSVGSIMNTDFVAVAVSTTVREALAKIQESAGQTELIYYLYVLEGDERLRGVVTLRHLLSAEPGMLMVDLMREQPIAVTAETSIKHAARIFFKYDFDAVPVIDEEGRMRGIVTMRDALEAVFPEVREESKG